MDRDRRLPIRLLSIGGVMLVALIASGVGSQDDPYEPARSLDDPRLGRLRQASASWGSRQGPRREVVDLVCLVPDAATFLEALASWDDSHWFPILIEDVEYTSKFLRAFRPSRVVRYPSRARPVEGEQRWSLAQAGVGRSWVASGARAEDASRLPANLNRTPPGVVLSNPGSPTLTGAAALAAGRFQPLLRWESEKGFDDRLSNADAQALARDLQRTVSRVVPRFGQLGDDCDFLTLGLDYPYFYEGKGVTAEPGPAAFDDLIGRHLDVAREDQVRIRWAFTGRLIGDEVQSAYAAMCSLFLSPETAAMVSAYGENPPFGQFQQKPAEDLLKDLIPVTRLDRNRSSLEGWHSFFDPVNRFGLVLINSSGGPGDFDLSGPKRGKALDVPFSEPVVVSMIHSFSAARPKDLNTIAARWLASGAYIYYGSAQEPYLTSFRTPELLVNLLSRGVPMGAATRLLPEESPPFGNCWRLVYLGDPLFRFEATPDRQRLGSWSIVDDWKTYEIPETPASAEDPFAVLSWAIRVSLDSASKGEPATELMIKALQAIDRDAFDDSLRVYRDLLLADALSQHDRLDVLAEELGRWPADSLGKAALRWLETARVASLQRALAADDWDQAASIWEATVRSSSSVNLVETLTDRVRPPKDQEARAVTWKTILERTRASLENEKVAKVVDKELDRLGE